MEGDDPDTRLFVSGLPPNFTSDQLGAHFAGRYQVTDAVIVPGRRFGFVGFRNYTLAKSAIKYFDKSYIRMSKISVGFAKPLEIERTNGSQTMSRPNPAASEGQNGSTSIAERTTDANDHSGTATDNTSAFRPYVSVIGSNKRKRDILTPSTGEAAGSQGYISPVKTDESKTGITTGSHDEEQESKEAKRARKKEKKEGKSKKEGNPEGEKADPMSNGSKTVALAQVFNPDTTVEQVSEAVQEGQGKKENKGKKKKNKDMQANNVDTTSSNAETSDIQIPQKSGDKPSRNLASLTDEGGAKGGPPYPAADSFEPLERPADSIAQHQPNTSTRSDADWLRAKTSRTLDLVDESPEEVREVEPLAHAEPHIIEELDQQKALLIEKSVAPSISPKEPALFLNGRLFMRNLSYSASEADLESLFSSHKGLVEVHLVRDKTGKSKGMAYAQFSDPDYARQVLQDLDGKTFQGRLLHILEADDQKHKRLNDFDISKLPLKQQKALKRKAETGKSSFNWNSLYMNPDAVLASVAERLGISKAILIDPSSSEAAVKLAHAEAHVIQDTKTFFTSSGVDMDAFKVRERDDRILLIKNFPFGTTVDDIKNLFSPYGEIIKCLLPPSGTVAIIEYSEAMAGTQAMKQLSYRNFKGAPLYLEMGPRDLFKGTKTAISTQQSAADTMNDSKKNLDHREAEPTSTLFVRNLDFATTTSGLTDAFKPLAGFLSATVKTKVDPRRPQEVLSQGFGFVEFRTNLNARAALETMNGFRLDKHYLLVQLSRRNTDDTEQQRQQGKRRVGEANQTKVIIKNIPFEATKKDIRALLGAYGQLRSVKVPQKFDHTTRGFAFADFVSAKEAENTMKALKDIHLLGRRLVFEFAAEDSIDPEEEILAMESKVGRQTETVDFKKMTGSTRKKFSVGGEDEQASL